MEHLYNMNPLGYSQHINNSCAQSATVVQVAAQAAVTTYTTQSAHHTNQQAGHHSGHFVDHTYLTPETDTRPEPTAAPPEPPPPEHHQQVQPNGVEIAQGTHTLGSWQSYYEERRKRLVAFKEKASRIKKYLRTGVHKPNLTKSQQRVVRGQAKTHIWDEERKELYYMPVANGRRMRLVTEESEIQDILSQYHISPTGSHLGRNSTLAKISEHFYWHLMKEDVKQYVERCSKCRTIEKIQMLAPPCPSITVEEALETVVMELMGPLPTTEEGNKYILIFTDIFTKFVEFFPLKDKKPGSVAKTVKSFICRWGAPHRLLLEHGVEYLTEVNNLVCHKFRLQQAIISCLQPEMNALDEDFSRLLRTRLNGVIREHPNDWEGCLEEVAWGMRVQQPPRIDYSPFFLMFGRRPRIPAQMELVSEGETLPDYSNDALATFVKLKDKKLAYAKKRMKWEKNLTKDERVQLVLMFGKDGDTTNFKNLTKEFNQLHPEREPVHHSHVKQVIMRFTATGSVLDKPRKKRALSLIHVPNDLKNTYGDDGDRVVVQVDPGDWPMEEMVIKQDID